MSLAKKVSEGIIYQTKYFEIIQFVLEKNGNKIVKEFIKRKNAVIILPVTEQNEVYLVTQFREALQEMNLGTISGLIENGNSPLEAAKRELKEESGLSAKEWQYLGTYNLSPNMINEFFIYIARGLEEGIATPDDDEQKLQTVKLPIKEAIKKAINGEINVLSNVAALLLLEKHLGRDSV